MKKISITKILVLFLSFVFVGCSSEDDKYLSFEGPQEAFLFVKTASLLEVTAAGQSFVEVEVGTTTKSDVDRVIPVSISPSTTATTNQYSVDLASIVIPAGKNTATIRINSGDFAALPLSGGTNLVLVFGDERYLIPNRTNHVVTIQRGCANTKVDFNITFDGWASEISWVLLNSSNTMVASSGAYTDGLPSFDQQFCLASGNYTFVMNDSFGDGLSDPTAGSFSIRLPNNGPVLLVGGGNFGTTTGPLSFTIN